MINTLKGKAVGHPCNPSTGSLRPRGSQILVHPELYSKFQTIFVYLTTLCQKIKKNKRNRNDFPVLCCNLFNMKPIQQKPGLELYSSAEFTCETHGTWGSFMYPRVNKTDSTGKERLYQKPSVTMMQKQNEARSCLTQANLFYCAFHN